MVRRFQWKCAGQLMVTTTTLKEKLSLNVMKLYRRPESGFQDIEKRKFIFKNLFFAKAREMIPSTFQFLNLRKILMVV